MMKIIQQLVCDFDLEISKLNKITEVSTFRSLYKAFKGKRGIIVKEYHAKSYVKFSIQDSHFRKIKTNGKCELSDLVIVTFSSKRSHPIKLTFLQAKILKNYLCHNNRINHNYTVDHTQWDLLHNRAKFIPTGQIKRKIPPDILCNAKYNSIGSYGFFIPDNNFKQVDFCYFSADILNPVVNIKGKSGRVTVTPKPIQNNDESIFSCCLMFFLDDLFSGKVGSPIHNIAEQSFVSNLIRSIENENPSQTEQDVIRSLREQLEINQEPENNTPFKSPGKFVLFIDTSMNNRVILS